MAAMRPDYWLYVRRRDGSERYLRADLFDLAHVEERIRSAGGWCEVRIGRPADLGAEIGAGVHRVAAASAG